MSFFRIQHKDYNPTDMLAEGQVSESYCTDIVREGKSVCATREALAAYLVQTGIPFNTDWILVELEGYASGDEDEDEHLGAFLIHPTKIVSVEPITDSFFDEIDAAADMLLAA